MNSNTEQEGQTPKQSLDEIDIIVRAFTRDVGVATLAANSATRAYTVDSANKSIASDTERFKQAIQSLINSKEIEVLKSIDNPTNVNIYDNGLVPVLDRITQLTERGE